MKILIDLKWICCRNLFIYLSNIKFEKNVDYKIKAYKAYKAACLFTWLLIIMTYYSSFYNFFITHVLIKTLSVVNALWFGFWLVWELFTFEGLTFPVLFLVLGTGGWHWSRGWKPLQVLQWQMPFSCWKLHVFNWWHHLSRFHHVFTYTYKFRRHKCLLILITIT